MKEMKTTKATYLSFFFLFCFIVSFGISGFQNFNTKFSKTNSFQKTTSVSSKEDTKTTANDLLFEENETDDDVEIASFILPLFFSYFHSELFQTKQFSAQPLAEKLTNAIYITVCNFRI